MKDSIRREHALPKVEEEEEDGEEGRERKGRQGKQAAGDVPWGSQRLCGHPGQRRAGPGWAPMWIPGGRRGQRGAGGLSCQEDMLHMMLDGGQGQSTPPQDSGLGTRAGLLSPGPPAGTEVAASTHGSRCRRRTWAGSPCTEAPAGGARETTPGSSLERAPTGGQEEARSSAGGFLTPAREAQRTSRGGSSPNNQPPAPPPSPCRPSPCLRICTRPSPQGCGSDRGGADPACGGSIRGSRLTATSQPEGGPAG